MTFLQRILLATYVVLLLAGVLLLNPFGFDKARIWVEPRLIAQHLLLLPLAALAVLGRSNGSSSPSRGGSLHALGLAVTSFLGLALVSTLAASDRELALAGFPMYPEGYLYYVLLLSVCVLAAWATSRFPRMLPASLGAAVVIGVAATTLALPQKANWSWDYTAHSAAVRTDEPNVTVAGVYRGQMPAATFWHRGFVGYAAMVGLVVAGGLFADANRRLDRRTRWMLGVAVAVCTTGLLIADTRTPVAAAAVGLTVALVTLRWRCRAVRRRSLRGLALLVFVGLVFGLAISGWTEVRERSFAGVLLGEAPSLQSAVALSGRADLWTVAWKGFVDNSVIGEGFFRFRTRLGEFRVDQARMAGRLPHGSTDAKVSVTQDMVTLSNDGSVIWRQVLRGSKPHNLFLEVALATGVVGLVGLLAVYAAVARALWRHPDYAWLSGLLVAWLLFAFFWYESVQISVLHWAVFGSAVGATAAARAAGRIGRSASDEELTS